jgi:hypothetical protein
MPFGLLFPDQIVNVKWGGGIFVVKSAEGFLYRGSGKNPEDWKSLGQPNAIHGFVGPNSGSSYAEIGKTDTEPGTPVFVISAVRDDDDDNRGSVILASRDGRDWKIVFEKYEVNDGDHRDPFIFEPTGIVWDEDANKFYAAFYTVIADFDTEGNVTARDGERIYSSSDGRSWGLEISDVGHENPPGLSEDSVSKLIQFCKKPENTKGDTEMPDGLQAYNEAGNTFMKPTSLVSFSPTNGAIYDGDKAAPSVTIITEDDDGNTITTTKSVNAPCYAVAQMGGMWAACGGDEPNLSINISTDGGETWTQVHTDTSGDSFWAATVSAGRGGKGSET